MLTCCHGYSLYILIFTFQLETSLATNLSQDTLKTINDNQVYEEGYYVSSRHRSSQKQCYYSASSSVGLTRLAQDEMKIYEALLDVQNHVVTANGNAFPPIVQEYLEDYEATSGVLIRNQRFKDVINKAAGPPGDLIGAYRMVRRYRNYILRDLFQALTRNLSALCQPNVLRALENLRPSTTMGPFNRDFHLTMFAIMHTQLKLGWKPADVSQGTIRGMELGPSLKAVHCVEIGVHAVATRFFPVGIEWLELALTQIQNGDKTIDFHFVLNLLQKSVAQHEKSWQPETPSKLRQVFYKTRLNDTIGKEGREWPRQLKAISRLDGDVIFTDTSWDVCAGTIQQTEAEKSKLFCWHETKVHPTWKLGPLKAELLAGHPFEVLQFHQVLQENTMERMKEHWGSRLMTPFINYQRHIFTPKRSLPEVVEIRDERLHRITERITGLKADYSGPIFGASYPPGGHLVLHLDKKGAQDFEEYITTMTYYLEEPEIGGETVIPASKVLAKAIKGSAILFYNVLQSSKYNGNSKHGSCPVVQGHKWIATNWVDYDSQTHLKRGLDKNSVMEYLVNGESKYKVV